MCPFIGSLFAEFASRVPATGGAYSYLYAILGEFPAWIARWLTIMEFMTAVSVVLPLVGQLILKGCLAFGISMPQVLNGTFNPEHGELISIS